MNQTVGLFRPFFLMLTLGLFSASCHALPKIAVLDFELNDLTSLPNVPEELARTHSFKPLLEEQLTQSGNYQVIDIDDKDYQRANAGFGYLFHLPEDAAQLARKAGADWVIVGQHSKPSFLETSLIADLVDVNTGKIKAEMVVDLKGNHHSVTFHAVDKIIEQIFRAVLI
jgi:hypothetical protein